MSLESKILEISDLTDENKRNMFCLMTEVYDGEVFERFLSDLGQKNYVLLLYNNSLEIVGFTTIEVFEFKGKIIIYSGDTVISEESRGDIELMRAWWRFSFSIQKKYPEHQVLWLLISKGWRTYKFFPMFLKETYPSRLRETSPEVQKFIDELSYYKFGRNYANGLVIPKNPDKLKSGKNDVPQKRLEDKDVEFFLRLNPEFYNGNELVCVAELSVSNLTKAGLRLLHGVRNNV